METIISQAKELAAKADETSREKMIIGLRDLATSLESRDDTIARISYSHLQIAGVRTGVDIKLFDQLAASDTPLALDQFTQSTGADSILLGRLLRYLASVGMIKETGKDTFASINVTKALAYPGNQATIRHNFDIVGPVYQEMPRFLRKVGYRNLTDNTKTVFQDAWKTDKLVFDWYPEAQPETFANTGESMASRREAMKTWLDVYPIEEETRGWDPEAPIFVDIGGGIGHHCAELKAKYPKLPGKVYLQDLADTIKQARPTPGVEAMEHDMFKPQPIKGARFYHLRTVLHDWSDDQCQLILRHLVAAMGKESSVLIEETVLPDTNVHWQATQLDLSMMCAFAARERTQDAWRALLGSVGLKIETILVQTPSVHESVIKAVPK